MKRYQLWTKIGVGLMILTGIFHGISLFVTSTPQNETERQLLDLMTNYRIDAGAGFHPSFGNLFTALSSCMTLLCFLGGATLIHLLRRKTAAETMRGVLTIHAVIFGVCFAMMAYFTFLPPIVCMGLIFVSLVVARLTVQSGQELN